MGGAWNILIEFPAFLPNTKGTVKHFHGQQRHVKHLRVSSMEVMIFLMSYCLESPLSARQSGHVLGNEKRGLNAWKFEWARYNLSNFTYHWKSIFLPHEKHWYSFISIAVNTRKICIFTFRYSNQAWVAMAIIMTFLHARWNLFGSVMLTEKHWTLFLVLFSLHFSRRLSGLRSSKWR